MRKYKLVSVVLVIILIGMLIIGCNTSKTETGSNQLEKQGAEQDEQWNLRFLTTDSSSSYYSYAAAVANAINKQIPEMNITVVETGGADENAMLMKQKEGEMAISNTRVASFAYQGKENFKDQSNDKLRFGWGFVPSPMNWIVLKDSNIKTFSDLEDKKFSAGGTGTTTEKMTMDVLGSLGISPDYYRGSMSDAQEAFANRQIVGLTKAGKAPDAYIQQVHATTPINILGFDKEQLELVLEDNSYFSPATIPGDAYDGVGEVSTVQVVMAVSLSADVSQEAGYNMMKALLSEEGQKIWASAYSAGANVDIANLTVQSAPIPLHAGVVQYLKEQGVDVPDKLVPPEYKD